ncbi:MAG: hypothetical protein FWE44_05155 [Defluviitaleaceae bacterium]|nr:hypothetical protein [Defluviitaleaceae bacterium]
MSHHICLPKQSLTRFSSKGALFCLDLNTNQITKTTPKSFLVSENYFTKDVEDKLSAGIETRIGRVCKKIDETIKRNMVSDKTIAKMTKLSKEIIAIQSIRNPGYMKNHFLPYSKTPPRGEGGAKFAASFILSGELYNTAIKEFNKAHNLDLKSMIILFNGTKRNFLLPTLHFYKYVYENQDIFAICLSPKFSLLLVDTNFYNEHYRNGFGSTGAKIFCEDQVIHFNKYAACFEKRYGIGKMVGSKIELNEIINFCEGCTFGC